MKCQAERGTFALSDTMGNGPTSAAEKLPGIIHRSRGTRKRRAAVPFSLINYEFLSIRQTISPLLSRVTLRISNSAIGPAPPNNSGPSRETFNSAANSRGMAVGALRTPPLRLPPPRRPRRWAGSPSLEKLKCHSN